jgi:chromosome segregation ATPase
MASRNLAAVLKDLHAAVQELQLEAGASRRRIEQLELLTAERAAMLRLVERVEQERFGSMSAMNATTRDLFVRVANLEEHQAADVVRLDTQAERLDQLRSAEQSADRMYTHQLAQQLDKLAARLDRLEALHSDRLEVLARVAAVEYDQAADVVRLDTQAERLAKLEAFAGPHVHHFGNVNDSHPCECGAMPPATAEGD